ncbi:hypothetical protein CRE_27226 [Caenorhabditis remanei]|uniref:Uncharacterized protein n=1 Tax=Caenorhabditis remanei TaxID=31234 RepID=E3LP64_CAERE|nr:hypothetical protein CRE_27226 [Caenorhabditis remanei]
MNEDINFVQSMVLSATLEGRTSTGGIRELCSHMPDKDMFRWKLEIAVKLREGKPKEALKLADVFKDDGKYPNGIETLVQCALRHIEIDNLLLKDGIDPPPPASFTPDKNYVHIPWNLIFNYQKTQKHNMLDFQKNEDGSTMSLPMSGYWDNSYFDALNPSKEDSSEDGNQNQIDSNIPKWYEDPHEFQRSSETSLSYQYRSETPETPQRSQHRPADDSGYWTSSNSSYNSAISHASLRRSESVNSEPSTPMKLPSLESWRKVCPAKETTVSTSQSSATELKRPMSILERLIAEDSPSPPPKREKPDRLVQQADLKDSRSASTGSKESDLREENTRTPQEGPFGEGWLNEVYWHHYQDFMNTNYYGIHGHQDQSTIPNNSNPSWHAGPHQ